MNYVKELEKQNEELQQKLAKCEEYAPYWHQQSTTLHYLMSVRCIYARIMVKYMTIGSIPPKHTFEIQYQFTEFRAVPQTFSSGKFEFDGVDKSRVYVLVEEAKKDIEWRLAGYEYGKDWIKIKEER